MVGVGPSVDSVSTLDCSNVLHLQNSDFNVTNVISIKLSGTENYRVWAAAMRLAINTRNKTGFIDGTCLKETYASSAVYSSQWDRCNSIVLSWLLNSVSDDLYLGQIFSENASEVWSELKELMISCGSVTLNLANKKFKTLNKDELNDTLLGITETLHLGLTISDLIVLIMLPLLRMVLHYLSTNGKREELMNLINDVPSGSNTGNIQANLAASLRWIIDSGANQHMTISTINMFGIVDVSDLSLTVGHPNGTLAKVKFVGNLKLNSHVTLYDVLVVPEYCDLVHSQIVGTGSENGGLYLFDYDSPKSSMCSNIGNMSAVCYVSKSLWHSRLGHPSDQALDVLQGNLRSDNGTEFVNNKMALLFNNLGIVHQTSCAYTPQQNGIAERKHRHLLNVARSLLFQSGIPLSMWPECILTAAYLVNRLPSSVLNGKFPLLACVSCQPNLSHS
ncbi:ribonuclease H-like domain-containing protein [Tanacetum coccineum]